MPLKFPDVRTRLPYPARVSSRDSGIEVLVGFTASDSIEASKGDVSFCDHKRGIARLHTHNNS